MKTRSLYVARLLKAHPTRVDMIMRRMLYSSSNLSDDIEEELSQFNTAVENAMRRKESDEPLIALLRNIFAMKCGTDHASIDWVLDFYKFEMELESLERKEQRKKSDSMFSDYMREQRDLLELLREDKTFPEFLDLPFDTER